MTVELVAGDARVVVDPAAGARATSWRVGDLELLGHADAGAGTPLSWGMYLMAPWAGRLRDSTLHHDGVARPMPVDDTGWALHGTVLDAVWTVGRVSDQRVELSVELAEPWPWAGRVHCAWELAPDRLVTRIEVEANDPPGFPASVGWHPWFRRRLAVGADLQVDVPGVEMLERGPDHLPTGRVLSPRPPGPYDDAFPLPGGHATLRWPGALELECRTDCRFLVLFDEQRDAVCVEPQTAPPDGPNTAPSLVVPGRPLVANATWSWTCEPPQAA